jgi:hypothetical protein
MSHSTIQNVNPSAKIGTPGSAGTLATARTPEQQESYSRTASNSMLKGTAETSTTPMVILGTSAIAERPVPVKGT